VFDISGWEFLTLAAIAVMIFGPERLPKFAADAGKFLREVREYVHGAKADLARELDMDLPDLRSVDLSARGLLRKTMGDEEFENPLAEFRKDFRGDVDALRAPLGLDSASSPVPLTKDSPVPLAKDEAPPWDPDTT
jgi:sec-independent protein translocase protein TatB